MPSALFKILDFAFFAPSITRNNWFLALGAKSSSLAFFSPIAMILSIPFNMPCTIPAWWKSRFVASPTKLYCHSYFPSIYDFVLRLAQHSQMLLFLLNPSHMNKSSTNCTEIVQEWKLLLPNTLPIALTWQVLLRNITYSLVTNRTAYQYLETYNYHS